MVYDILLYVDDVFDAAERYKQEGRQLIVLAGKDYGSGSSRDWAAKGPWMLVSPLCDHDHVCPLTSCNVVV